MFVPSHYRPPDTSWMVEIITGNPLALMTSNGATGDVPFATHLPVIPEFVDAASADLAGSVLLCHLNRANPHWAALKDGGAVLLTFTGPHAYVTPAVYEYTPCAPTWNFTSVHVRGIVQKLDSIDDTLHVVQATVHAFEEKFGSHWDMRDSLGYFRKIAPAVGALRVRVIRCEGMFKLSQEQRREVRDRVRSSFNRHPSTQCRDVAELMGRLP
ncbi:FMN-binding negative transcriptional regulator [Thermopolyspora sp. NPDC052614]|uniref:FMN-binding negative transcriptional regulator n=1 Tax=Thermopolyspora sp. NPDC052614 TaxID=3155682 RepID=UPI0034443119